MLFFLPFPKGRVSDRDTLLIMGTADGVGSSAVQLAKIRGAKVSNCRQK
ncbi:MAG: hypothetical protein F6K40_29290 [Okeania sp. SIO3I5]|nr:hypothetical protein [Okeania sp. SIO3I5]NEQ40114.1 hypothetical protein [Okeania sp. SIO3I5]